MKEFKKQVVAGLLAMGLVTPVMAEDGASWNVSFVSDYVWRGDSQTSLNPGIEGGKPTIQGGWDYEKGQWSVGIWASGLASGSEFDAYGAYKIGSVKLGAIYYYFPANPLANAYEINVGSELGPVELVASYSPVGGAYYLEANYEHKLSAQFGVELHAGYVNNNLGITATDYSIGLGTTYEGAELALTYANKQNALGLVYVSVSKSM